MDLKSIQKKLEILRDRIRAEGRISETSEHELKNLLNNTLASASQELSTIQDRLTATIALQAGNDNITKPVNTTLSDEQKKRLSFVEKSGSGSHTVH